MKPLSDEKHATDLMPFCSHGACGYKNKISDEIEVPLIYETAGEFSEGLARVKQNGLYGFIDTQGNLSIPCKYKDALRFNSGMAAVMDNDTWGFIDTKGTMIIPAEFDYIRSFSEGLAPVKKNGKWGYINTAGKLVVGFIYDIADRFCEGLARVKSGEKSGYIHSDGTTAIAFRYDKATDFISGYAVVEIDEKQGLINREGKEIFPCVCEYIALPFRDGITIIKHNGKYGYIDEKGCITINCQYDHAHYFINGKAEVQQGDQRFYIDTSGNRLPEK